MTKILLTTEPKMVVDGTKTTFIKTPKYSKVRFSTEPCKEKFATILFNDLTVSEGYTIYAWVESEPTLIEVFGSSGWEDNKLQSKLNEGTITQQQYDEQLEVQNKTNYNFSEKEDTLKYLTGYLKFENGKHVETFGYSYSGFVHRTDEYNLLLDYKDDLAGLGYRMEVIKWSNYRAKGRDIVVYDKGYVKPSTIKTWWEKIFS